MKLSLARIVSLLCIFNLYTNINININIKFSRRVMFELGYSSACCYKIRNFHFRNKKIETPKTMVSLREQKVCYIFLSFTTAHQLRMTCVSFELYC